MRQPAIKPLISYKIYPQNILRIFYRPARLIYILDPRSILPIMQTGISLARNSSSILQLWLSL